MAFAWDGDGEGGCAADGGSTEMPNNTSALTYLIDTHKPCTRQHRD